MPAPPLPYPTLSPIRLEPTEGGTDEFPGAFGGCPCRAFNFATSAASASTSSINCSRLNSASASRPSEQQLIEIHPLLPPGRSCAGEQIRFYYASKKRYSPERLSKGFNRYRFRVLSMRAPVFRSNEGMELALCTRLPRSGLLGNPYPYTRMLMRYRGVCERACSASFLEEFISEARPLKQA
jgi:hypothetical protein